MTYDAANERFSYDLTDITTGDYCYYYTVDGEEKLDAFNENTKIMLERHAVSATTRNSI